MKASLSMAALLLAAVIPAANAQTELAIAEQTGIRSNISAKDQQILKLEAQIAALQAELERVRDVHGVAILYDCHSIRSGIPFLFDGTLPDFNIGTNMGTTCASGIEIAAQTVCNAASGYTSITNGRFKGGWTTRHYGQPDKGMHAIQMELAQSTYLTAETSPWTFDDNKAAVLRPHLTSILTQLAVLAPSLKGTS